VRCALQADEYLPLLGPSGLVDYAAAFSAIGVETDGVHQRVVNAAAELLIDRILAQGGGAEGDGAEGEGAEGEGAEGEGAEGEGAAGGGEVFTCYELERLVRCMLVRKREEVDLWPLVTVLQVRCGECACGDGCGCTM